MVFLLLYVLHCQLCRHFTLPHTPPICLAARPTALRCCVVTAHSAPWLRPYSISFVNRQPCIVPLCWAGPAHQLAPADAAAAVCHHHSQQQRLAFGAHTIGSSSAPHPTHATLGSTAVAASRQPHPQAAAMEARCRPTPSWSGCGSKADMHRRPPEWPLAGRPHPLQALGVPSRVVVEMRGVSAAMRRRWWLQRL